MYNSIRIKHIYLNCNLLKIIQYKKGNNMTDLSSKIKLYLIIIIIFLSACNDSSGGIY